MQSGRRSGVRAPQCPQFVERSLFDALKREI